MNGDKLKKQLILNLPYILIGLYATKLGEAWRLAEGADASQKFLHLMDGFTAAFQSALPSFHPSDLLVGLVIGCVLRLLVYEKSRNAKSIGAMKSTAPPAGVRTRILRRSLIRIHGTM